MRLCFPFLRPVRFFSPVYSFLYNSFVCFLFFSVSATYGGESESVRKGCFSGVAEFAKSVSVSLGETDENLKILKSILRSEYVWVVDSTPSKNSD
nr:hypothetical protein [Leptospira ellisii]PJZ90808.1 hypothetical protein CH379_22250 [Leptospira ellisii]